ncbi:hypothetical protein [Hydrogenophaga sp.]|uniref:hypothetical protein n=1 Tax=Hydrogenophaga sp. TaxID=1904254 RepID=UPI002722E933|nr:hypothetical protein [Hydrogenophaga sp.]MDO8903967.1 hypothetical protein [Hydrogenophaga sp.]
MPTFTTNSLRWQIFDSVATALEAAPELQSVRVRRNPRQSVKVGKNDFLIVIRWEPDTLIQAKGHKEDRKFRLLVGSIANTDQADSDADAMQLVVGGVVRKQWVSLSVFANKVKPREIEVVPDVENMLIEGSLVASAWDIDYELVHSATGA